MKHLVLSTLVVLGASTAAHASSISAADVVYNIAVPMFSDSDSDTVNGGTATATVMTSGGIGSPGIPTSSSATQNDDGTSFVSAGGSFADGQTGHSGTSAATYTQSVTNNSGGLQEYSMDFFLAGMKILLNGDFGGANNTGNPFPSLSGGSVGGFINFVVEVDSVPFYTANIEAFGGAGNYQLANADKLVGNLSGTPTGASVEVDLILDTLTFAPVADGDTMEVKTILTAGFFANGFENEVGVFVSDPNNISQIGPLRLSSVPPPPPAVPLPAAGWLLVAGLGAVGALGAMKSRQKA